MFSRVSLRFDQFRGVWGTSGGTKARLAVRTHQALGHRSDSARGGSDGRRGVARMSNLGSRGFMTLGAQILGAVVITTVDKVDRLRRSRHSRRRSSLRARLPGIVWSRRRVDWIHLSRRPGRGRAAKEGPSQGTEGKEEAEGKERLVTEG